MGRIDGQDGKLEFNELIKVYPLHICSCTMRPIHQKTDYHYASFEIRETFRG